MKSTISSTANKKRQSIKQHCRSIPVITATLTSPEHDSNPLDNSFQESLSEIESLNPSLHFNSTDLETIRKWIQLLSMKCSQEAAMKRRNTLANKLILQIRNRKLEAPFVQGGDTDLGDTSGRDEPQKLPQKMQFFERKTLMEQYQNRPTKFLNDIPSTNESTISWQQLASPDRSRPLQGFKKQMQQTMSKDGERLSLEPTASIISNNENENTVNIQNCKNENHKLEIKECRSQFRIELKPCEYEKGGFSKAKSYEKNYFSGLHKKYEGIKQELVRSLEKVQEQRKKLTASKPQNKNQARSREFLQRFIFSNEKSDKENNDKTNEKSTEKKDSKKSSNAKKEGSNPPSHSKQETAEFRLCDSQMSQLNMFSVVDESSINLDWTDERLQKLMAEAHDLHLQSPHMFRQFYQYINNLSRPMHKENPTQQQKKKTMKKKNLSNCFKDTSKSLRQLR